MHCGCILLKQTNQLTSLDDEDEYYFFWLEILYTDWLVDKTFGEQGHNNCFEKGDTLVKLNAAERIWLQYGEWEEERKRRQVCSHSEESYEKQINKCQT